ncbi:MAG: extracellular solute-binding protein [Acidimicrobiales bacterium]
MSWLSNVETTGGRVVAPRRLVVTALSLTLIVASVVLSALTSPPASASSIAKASGAVNVLYAGSFLDLMERRIGPAFKKATGYTISGFSAGSSALATEIKGGTQVGDVFISASPTVDTTLQGMANGNWVSSYQEFGRSPLVLGYNPSSKFVHLLKTQPWYNVVELPGFLLGRTDPSTDPKGVLAVDALTGVALSYNKPALAPLASSTSNEFQETALVGDLQAGQLDAGFFYGVEASAAHLKTVPVTGTGLAADYAVAILKDAPHLAGARAFVKFLLSKVGRKILSANGVSSFVPPLLFTSRATSDTTTTTP